MTLRTPRRRISPRTKRRYRAIKDFVRRALGTSSQPGTKTSSSIEVSISDLKNKIIGIEEQLNRVSKHCQDISCLGHSFRKESQAQFQLQRDDGSLTQQENCDTDVNDVETKLLYKSSTSQHRQPDEDHNNVHNDRHDDTTDMVSADRNVAQNIQDFQFKENNEFREKRRTRNDFDLVVKGKTRSKYKTMEPIYSTSSFHSLIESGNKKNSKPGFSSHRYEKRKLRKEYTDSFVLKEHIDRETVKKVLKNQEREYDDRHKNKRAKRVYSEVDKDFITDIIKRQYRPVKVFGRRDSDFSQFSAPVCRDQEFTVRDEIQEGIELCSCCFDDCRRKRHRYVRHSDLSDMRSICDTRLYSSKKSRRHKLERDYLDDYNNSALYDVVPVKEKSSPKTRRKFTEDNIMIANQFCKEVPPSPRSHRPRLNLKVQRYPEYEDCLYNERHQSRRPSPAREHRKKVTNVIESDVSSAYYPQRIHPEILNSSKSQKPVQIYEDVGTMSSLQYPNFGNEQVNIPNIDTPLNTQLTDSSADKTEKTLSEIKDILRTFLLEIKKDSTCSDKSEGTSKIENKQLIQNQSTKTNSNIIPDGNSFNNYGVGQCGIPPFLPAFPNPCCYPILPVCPMNCMQNGYIIPSPSYACTACAKTSKEHTGPDKDSSHKTKASEEVNTKNETQELIKEIYKFVSQKPKSPRTKEEYGNEDHSARSRSGRFLDRKVVTRYVGGSTKASKHDANVGTSHIKCYSKSCEAIGSRIASDTYNTNASYSDTVLEKLSLEVTQSSTGTDISTDVPAEKVKRGKLKKVLNPWKLFKKKKKDEIKEMSESESTVEVEVKPKPPFKQHIQSYAMHGQEYCHPPPMPGPHCCASPRYDYCGHSYEQRHSYRPPPPPPDVYNHYSHHHDHAQAAHYNPKYPTAPPYPSYDRHYNQIPPQVPLCLKEIEVKSIGTQSERKVSILRRFAKKIPMEQQQEQSTSRNVTPIKEKPNFWKTLQERSKQNENDTMNFSLKMQKQLAQGDMNMKNAMMKKLFYKKNPFSPRNLIVRTLLGKDKSSYGNPPKMYRPRMFI